MNVLIGPKSRSSTRQRHNLQGSEGCYSGRKKTHKHERFALVNVQMALGQLVGCPRVNRAKKFMCSPRNTGKINFSLWLPAGCPRVVPTFKKFMCSKFMCFCLALVTPHELSNVKHGNIASVTQPSECQQYKGNL